jgi:transcriptional regulator with XRE-family HTH domain
MDAAGVTKKRFGAAVRRFREAKQLSQEELADLVGIHRTYIGGIERGERNPTLTMIERIAAALDLEPASLVRHSKE